jgi:hypothetical protein
MHSSEKSSNEVRRESIPDGTDVTPKGLALFLSFMSIVVGILSTGQWLLEVVHFFSHR